MQERGNCRIELEPVLEMQAHQVKHLGSLISGAALTVRRCSQILRVRSASGLCRGVILISFALQHRMPTERLEQAQDQLQDGQGGEMGLGLVWILFALHSKEVDSPSHCVCYDTHLVLLI